MTSSNGNFFRITGLLWGEFTGYRWIPHTKASNVELWFVLWSAPEHTVEKKCWRRWFKTPLRTLWRHCNVPINSSGCFHIPLCVCLCLDIEQHWVNANCWFCNPQHSFNHTVKRLIKNFALLEKASTLCVCVCFLVPRRLLSYPFGWVWSKGPCYFIIGWHSHSVPDSVCYVRSFMFKLLLIICSRSMHLSSTVFSSSSTVLRPPLFPIEWFDCFLFLKPYVSMFAFQRNNWKRLSFDSFALAPFSQPARYSLRREWRKYASAN